MSNKARRYAAINTSANIATVVVASSLTFMGFAGVPKIRGYLNIAVAVEEPTVELLQSFGVRPLRFSNSALSVSVRRASVRGSTGHSFSHLSAT